MYSNTASTNNNNDVNDILITINGKIRIKKYFFLLWANVILSHNWIRINKLKCVKFKSIHLNYIQIFLIFYNIFNIWYYVLKYNFKSNL